MYYLETDIYSQYITEGFAGPSFCAIITQLWITSNKIQGDQTDRQVIFSWMSTFWFCEGGIAASSSCSEGHVHLWAPGQNCNSGVWGKRNIYLWIYGGVVTCCMSVHMSEGRGCSVLAVFFLLHSHLRAQSDCGLLHVPHLTVVSSFPFPRIMN